jgi:histidinol phosphatase-like PHP family hydrolase
MAHPFEAVCCPYDNELIMKLISDDDYRRIYDATAKKGIAVEINVAGVQNDREKILASEKLRGFRLAKECGCKFTFGSDSHNDREHDNFAAVSAIFARELGLKENDLAEKVR